MSSSGVPGGFEMIKDRIFSSTAPTRKPEREHQTKPFDTAHPRMTQEVSVIAVIRNLIARRAYQPSVRKKVRDLGFATHLEHCLAAHPAAVCSKVPEITAVLKPVLGSHGACALGCTGASVGSPSDQTGPLWVPVAGCGT